MKKMMLMLGAALLALNTLAGTGATTNWVARFVAEYVANAISNSPAEMVTRSAASTSNGVTTVSAGTGDYVLCASWENADTLAIVATNCTAAAVAANVSNGEKWAAGASGGFTGATVPPITRTATNYVCGAFRTLGATPLAFYSGTNKVFETSAFYVTPSQARQIKGE